MGLRNGNRGRARNESKPSDASRLSKQTRDEGRGSGRSTKRLMYFPYLFMTNGWGRGGRRFDSGVGQVFVRTGRNRRLMF